MSIYNFIQTKQINSKLFLEYLAMANKTNQFTNGGYAVRQLEQRARTMLQITDNKAVIATNSGTSALHAIILTLNKHLGKLRLATQSFNFPSAIQGPAKDSKILDFDDSLDIDLSNIDDIDVLIPTNCFGHLQNIDKIQNKGKIVIYDNAASPYSFWRGYNSCNYGVASFISLHHTKPLGFGEGGLVIIDSYYEQTVRAIIAFDKQANGSFTRLGNNYKMSELAAAGILQWWDQFDINKLKDMYFTRYITLKESLLNQVNFFKHSAAANEIFFPNCLPVLYTDKNIESKNAMKYYKPLDNSKIANDVYNKISCLPLAD